MKKGITVAIVVAVVGAICVVLKRERSLSEL